MAVSVRGGELVWLPPSSRPGRLVSTDLSLEAQGEHSLATAIEKFLYEDRAAHGVVALAVSPGAVRLHLAPWAGPQVHNYAVFSDARLTSAEAYPDEHRPLDPPWDVIGFDCYDLGGGRWRFVLHCDVIEWCFEATWPVVSREEGRPQPGLQR